MKRLHGGDSEREEGEVVAGQQKVQILQGNLLRVFQVALVLIILG